MPAKKSNSSNSSKGLEGNTNSKPKQEYSKANWVFTLHNYTEDDIIFLKNLWRDSCKWWIFSEEKGKSGETPHLQGYCSFKVRTRFTALTKINPLIHWEPAGGSKEQNIYYITKEGGKCYGNLLKEMIEVEPIVDKLKFMWNLICCYINEWPKSGDRKIHVIVDEVGGLGKTEFARYCVMNLDRCIVTSGKASDMKNQIVMYNDKNGCLPQVIICDVPRACVNYISYTGIEEIKNMLFYSGKYEGAMVNGNKPFVLLMMNEMPSIGEMSEDRWVIHNISR